MRNHFFSFKQFTIQQDKCAMKVCTDACLFGSLAATHANEKQTIQVLDIGIGTGLLTLMFAQKHANAIIDAIEIDGAAAQQATENINASPWKKRLHVIQGDIKKIPLHKQYDFIITNPPFFENSLKSNSSKRNIALHGEALHLKELLTIIKKYLCVRGQCIILLSLSTTFSFEQALAQEHLYIQEKIFIKQTPQHPYFRTVLLFSKQKTETTISEIIIQNEDGQYTPAFIALLKDYYLNF